MSKNILLIDKRVQDYETIVAAIDPALAVGVVFDYYEDTFDTVKARIGALGLTTGTNQISVGLIQHNYKAPMFTMLASADVAPVAQVESQDPELERWSQFRDFITWCKTELNTAHFDMMACALYSDPDWKYVIDTLTAQTGVTVRASTDDTGAASLGGDWFLESHTGVNLKTVYFTEAIEAYRGVLRIIMNYQYITKSFATGDVVAWGNSVRGGTAPSSVTNVGSNVVAVYSNAYSFAALKTDGRVVAWGDSTYGGTAPSSVIDTGSNVISISATRYAFAALKSNGSVIAWGDSATGGLTWYPTQNGYNYNNTAINSNVLALYSTGQAFAALKTDGSVIIWGNNGGDRTQQVWSGPYYGVPVSNNISSGIVAVYSNFYAFAAIKSNGAVIAWGQTDNGGTTPDNVSSNVVAVYASYSAFAALKTNGSIVAWGGGAGGGVLETVSTYPTIVANITARVNSEVIAVFPGYSGFAVLKANGSVVSWPALAPYSSLASGVVAVYTASSAFAALKSNGSIVIWGSDGYGGNATSTELANLTGVVSIVSTSYAFAALKSNGTVATWGHTNYGGSSSSVSAHLVNVVAIYATDQAFAAVKTDGTVVSWGHTNYGGSSSLVDASLNNVMSIQSNESSFASIVSTETSFNLSSAIYSDMDRYNILRKIENRRRVNLKSLNNNVFTLSQSFDVKLINREIPSNTTLSIIVPDYYGTFPLSRTSTATLPTNNGNFIVACDEGEPVTISGTSYVNFGSFVYKLETNNTYTKLVTTTIGAQSYTLYGGDSINSSGIVFVRIKPSAVLSTFVVDTPKTFGAVPFSITAPTSDSSGAITYSSNDTSVATINPSSGIITLVAAGTVTFTASQAESSQYAASTPVTSNTLTVSKGTTSLTSFSVAGSKTFGAVPFSIDTAPTSDSSGAITYSSNATNVATIDASSGIITLVAGGTVTFTASQAESAQYNAPTPVTSNTLTVSKVTPTLVFVNPPVNKSLTDASFAVTATSGIPISVSNSGSGAYIVNGSSNSALTVIRGMRYIFSVNASGHPFWIQTVNGAYSSGNIYSNSSIVNNGSPLGNIIWEVPFNTAMVANPSTGITWTGITSAAANSWSSVAYGDGIWVAVATSGTETTKVMSSFDGITWTYRTWPLYVNWNSVAYGNGLWVAVGYNGLISNVMTSPDGITWTTRNSASSTASWSSVAYGNGLWVAVASSGSGNRIMTSPNGITWTSRTAAETLAWNSVAYGNGSWVAVSSDASGKIITSANGIDWTVRTVSLAYCRSVAYGNGLWVAVSGNSDNKVMTSTNGTNWTVITVTGANKVWTSVAYGNGLWVAVASTGSGNRVMTSPNGTTWTFRTSAADSGWMSVAYGNGLWVAVSEFSSSGTMMMTSGENFILNSPNTLYYASQNNSSMRGIINVIDGPIGTSSSGAITYSSNATSIATIDSSSGIVTLVDVGTATFTASQVESAQYNAPTPVTSNTLTVAQGTTSLTSFSVAESKTFGAVPFSITAPTTASSGAITYSSNATSVATIDPSSGIITLVAAGTATFTASQAESAQYNAPTPVTSNTLTVSKVTPTLVFVNPPANKSVADPAFTVTATSGIPINISVSGSGAYIVD